MSRLALSILVGASLASGFRRTFGTAERQADQLGNAMSRNQAAAGRLNGYRKLGQSVMKMTRDHEAAKAELASVRREMKATDAPSKELSARFDSARTSVENTGRALQRSKRRLSEMRTEMKAAGQSTRDLTGEQKRLAREYEALARQRARLQNIDAARVANRDRRGQLQGQMLGAGAMAFGLFNAFRPAANFEEGVASVGAITNASDEDLARLAKAARQKRLKEFSATETTAAQGYLGMAGFSPQEIIDAQLDVQKLALAGRTDLALTSDISSDILSGFGKEAGELGKVGDILAKTFTTSNTNLAMLGDTLKYIGPVARSTHTPLETAAAMTGLLANVGIKGSQAGTSLRAMFSRLSAPVGEASDVLRDLGVETRDVEGNLRSIPEILKEMATATEHMGTGERAEVLKKVFGEEPAAAVAELLSQAASGGLDAYIATINGAGGTLDKIAEKMGERSKASFKALASSAESIAISFGTLLLPALSDVAQGVAGLMEAAAALAEEFPILSKLAIGAAAGLIGLNVASIAARFAWTFMVGGMLSVRRGLVGLQTIYTLVTGRTAAFSAASLLARTRTLALGAAMLLSGGRARAGAFASGIATAMSRLMSFAKTAVPMALTAARTLGTGLLTALGPIGWAILGLITFGSLLYAYWDDVKGYFNETVDWIAGLLEGLGVDTDAAWTTIKAILSWTPLGMIISNWSGISAALTDPLGTAQTAIDDIWSAITSVLDWSPVETLRKRWAGVEDAILGPLRGARNAASEILDSIASLFDDDDEEDGEQRTRSTRRSRRRGLSVAESIAANDNAASRIAEPVAERIADRPAQEPVATSRTVGNLALAADPTPAPSPHSDSEPSTVVHITINAAPGQSEEAIARAVKRVLQQERRRSLHDG